MADVTNNENLNSPNETEEAVTETVETETEVEAAPADAEVDVVELKATNKRLFERAKKAEAENRTLKGKKANETQTVQKQIPQSGVDVDERILKANGMPAPLLTELKAIATLRGVNLIDAQKDSLFIAVKENYDKDEKRKAASLGASRGSGGVVLKKDIATPNLSRDEHRKMFQERIGR
jgi:hypothetical protein